MPKRSPLSIPDELHQIKAREIYERRIARGTRGSPEGDWETARRYLTKHPKVVRAWKRKRAIAFYRRLPRLFFRRLWRSFKALIGVIGKILTFPLWLFYKLPQLFADTDTRPFALDVVQTIISAASLIATIIAAIGLLISYQDAIQDRQLTQERLVTDRFAKAVEQLGNGKEVVVTGGIYSLERIAKDSPKDQWTIMEILTAFVRKNSPIPPEIRELEYGSQEKLKASQELEPVNIQTQAALTVIGRRDPEQDHTLDKDPEQNKILDTRQTIIGQQNSKQDSSDRDSEENTKRLDLSYTNLNGADLTSADLRDANLRDAFLNGVKNLSNKQIKSACFWQDAIYTVAIRDNIQEKWTAKDEKANQRRIKDIKQDKASDPDEPPDCDQWK